MQALFLQFLDPRQAEPRPRFSHSIGVASALLRREGFDASLAALPGYRPDLLHRAVIDHRPSYVLCELGPFSVAAARRTLATVAERYQLPVILFGPYATCQPRRVLTFPGAEALILGDWEVPAAGLLRALRDGGDGSEVPGVWTQVGGELRRNAPADPPDPDALPFPDRDLFDCGSLVRATGELHFKAVRGCPLWCAYCVNDWYMDLYEGAGAFVRRRSVGNLLAEIAQVLPRYDAARSIAFYDHAFASDADWLAEFAVDYPRRSPLPYRCHVRLEQVDQRVASRLAQSNCRWVHTHIGSGSRFIRDEILSMRLSDEGIIEACRALRAAGLRVAAEVFIGCPYESEITLEETIELLGRAEFDEVHPRVFYPVPGSRAAELCRENGWISGRGEENYWRGHSVLDMPSLPAERIDAVHRKFPSLLRRPSGSSLRKLLRKIRRRRKGALRSPGRRKSAP